MGRRKKRRPSGEGTVWYEEKTQRWRARVPYQAPEGTKDKKLSAKSEKEILKKKAEFIAERDQGLFFEAENITVAEYLKRWLNGPAKKNIRPSTYARYEQLARKHLVPAL